MATGGEVVAPPFLDGDGDLIEALGSELLLHFSIDAGQVVAEDE